ncbi:hypothetical protein PoB_005493600 [Plakobranchus ocellatus]|uniref:Uncharacterized protein n=1 Tax=Plakobranchus ocellatus TaxID=259542 RepID=A0AAV4C6V2_9GAST|nr:hypothetical protein PoB_005493600 [Plakobranchus ocellatus]
MQFPRPADQFPEPLGQAKGLTEHQYDMLTFGFACLGNYVTSLEPVGNERSSNCRLLGQQNLTESVLSRFTELKR